MATTAETNHEAAQHLVYDSPRMNEDMTCIDSELYKAAVEGNFNKFMSVPNVESLLTPNKNTVLHIHLTSTTTQPTQSLPHPFVQHIQCMICNLIMNTRVETTTVSEFFVEQILKKSEGRVLVPNSKGETPLHLAARYGHTGITKLLIEHARTLGHDEIESGIEGGKKLTRAKTEGSEDTALHEAVRHNHVEVVEILLEMDPDLSNIANKAQETPLYLAAERHYTSIVQIILDKVESPAYEGPHGRTALHAAVIHPDPAMVVNLLKNEHVRAAVKHPDSNHWVPLYYAVKAGNVVLTELLLKQDKKTAYMQDKNGCTALHIAAMHGKSFVLKMIIRYCPDSSEIVDDQGRNALHHAIIAEGDPVVARIMRNLSLSNLYNEKNKDGDTPLHCLAGGQKSKSRILMWMLHGRVDKLALNNSNQTALDVAFDTAESSHLRKQNMIYGLLKAGAERSQRLNYTELKKARMVIFSKEAKESHLIMATLIATVTFAAAFTLPGGTFQDGELKGSPILRGKASFKAFIVSNTIAMVMASSAALIHLFSPRNDAQWLDSLFCEAAFSFTLVAVAAMIVAFGTGMYAVLGSSSIGIAVITVALFFFFVFRQLLRMSFRDYPLFSSSAGLANVILFPFLRFGSRSLAFFFQAFRVSSDKNHKVDEKLPDSK